VSRAEFQQLSQPSEQGQPSNLDLLMDINLPVSIELGRTRMPIAELLALGPGSVVELNKLAGEPVDVMVNQKLVARGEVVVIDENFGVRITQLMTPEERLKLLGEDV
jgi:flagellar motor switch protein FliN/FliY